MTVPSLKAAIQVISGSGVSGLESMRINIEGGTGLSMAQAVGYSPNIHALSNQQCSVSVPKEVEPDLGQFRVTGKELSEPVGNSMRMDPPFHIE